MIEGDQTYNYSDSENQVCKIFHCFILNVIRERNLRDSNPRRILTLGALVKRCLKPLGHQSKTVPIGLEPITTPLTAEGSTIELQDINIYFFFLFLYLNFYEFLLTNDNLDTIILNCFHYY